MPTQSELDSVYIGTAILHSRLSKAVRSKVGAVLVTRNGVCLTGYNGTPAGMDNSCEYEENGLLVTKKDVIHAEQNTILKAAREGISILGSKLYLTLSPCIPCASMILSAGITEVIYAEKYRDASSIDYLINAGVTVRQIG
jgi:dCMP deaminase